jgi:hypothetical protein
MKRLLNSVVLLIVAIKLAAILFPIGAVYAFVYTIVTMRIETSSAYWANLFYAVALGIDKIGNVMCGELFNRTLVINNAWVYKFGNINDTISYVLAKNYPKRTTRAGNAVVWVLEKLDKGHMEKSLKRKY